MGVPLMLWLAPKRFIPAVILALFGGLAMLVTPLKRLWRSGRYRASSIFLVPVIRVTGDLAKMWGFPLGLVEGWANRGRTRAYLKGELAERAAAERSEA
jgi:hypothetical protein